MNEQPQQAISKGARTDVKMIFTLTLVHFTGDLYSSFVNPLFPLFVEKLGLSLTQVGLIAGTNRFLAFIVQPTVGYLADRHPSRAFILAGLLLAICFIPLAGIAPGFWTLLILVAVGSIGSSMFHPPVTGMVPLYAGSNSGFSMSIFNTGGTLAFGLGPLFVTWYAARFGLGALPFTMCFGWIILAYLAVTIPKPGGDASTRLGFFGSIRENLGDAWKIVAVIWLVMFLRAVVGQSFLTFLPVLLVQKGLTVVSAGVVFSLFTVAGTFSGLIAGRISDKIGFRPVFLCAHGLMTPVLLLFLRLEGDAVYIGALAAGATVLATLPLGVAMAQLLAPRGRSMVASLMMGFAYGLGGLITPLVGRLADLYSIPSVLNAICLIPLATLPLILTFPKVK
ncbi:MAG: MFS transporter [Thermodesulfobacteriota bacterium]